jgi:hypothetical protein
MALRLEAWTNPLFSGHTARLRRVQHSKRADAAGGSRPGGDTMRDLDVQTVELGALQQKLAKA